jgi:hypothetical protein
MNTGAPLDLRANFIDKSFGERLLELISSLLVIRDSLAAVNRGDDHQFLPLYAQLRLLLTEKSNRSAPLLLDLAMQAEHTLDFFTLDAQSVPGAVLHIRSGPFTLTRVLPAQRSTTLSDFLQRELVTYKGIAYTAANIIDRLANRSGGAHFSPAESQDHVELGAIRIGRQHPLAYVFGKLAELILALGARFLASLGNSSLHFAIMALPRHEYTGVIWDASYPLTPLRRTIEVSRGKLIFRVVGLAGTTLEVGCETEIDWRRRHHILASIAIRPDLQTAIEILIDGKEQRITTVSKPIFVVSGLGFELYFNRSRDEPQSGLNFGLVEFIETSGLTPELDRARLLSYFNPEVLRREEKVVLFGSDGYGYTPPDGRAMKMTGDVINSTVGQIETMKIG